MPLRVPLAILTIGGAIALVLALSANAQTGTPGNVRTATGHIHGHVMPMPGESMLTLLPENIRASNRYVKRHRRTRPAYCTSPSGGMNSLARIQCAYYTQVGDRCFAQWGATTRCITSTCRLTTCICSFYTDTWVEL